MRVYLFNVDSGIYEGEDYCEPKEVKEEDGITALPPPDSPPGQVAVYDRELGNWQLIPSEGLGGARND